MIKVFKLQRPILLIVLGVLAFIASKILSEKSDNEYYLEELGGALLIAGALWALYPILFAKKVGDGKVEIRSSSKAEPTDDSVKD